MMMTYCWNCNFNCIIRLDNNVCCFTQLKKYWLCFQTITIKRSSSAQGGAGNYEVITIDDDDEAIPAETKTADNRTSQMITHLDQSGSRTDYLARGGSSISQRDYLSRGGTQTLGSSVRVENMTALRSTPQWLTATGKTTPSVGITVVCWVSLHVNMTYRLMLSGLQGLFSLEFILLLY